MKLRLISTNTYMTATCPGHGDGMREVARKPQGESRPPAATLTTRGRLRRCARRPTLRHLWKSIQTKRDRFTANGSGRFENGFRRYDATSSNATW